MRKNSFSASSFVIALLLGGLAVDALPLAPAAAASNPPCTNLSDPFNVNGAIWGTSGSPASAYPGEQNVPLTITFLFSGPCSSPQTTFFLGLTQGPNQIPFLGLNGVQEPSDVALNISPNTIVTETFYLNIDQTAMTNLTYYIPLIIVYSNNSISSPVTQTLKASGGQLVAPIALYGQVQLAFTASTAQVLGGSTDNVTVTIANKGAGSAGPVTTTVSAPVGVTVLNEFAVTPALPPGANYTQPLQLFVSSSLSGTAFVLSFTAKYLDPYSNSQTTTQTLGFTVLSSAGSASSSSFLVEGASWGSASSSSSPLPGSQDTALVVSLQYLGSAPVNSLEGTLQLPAGFTDLNGNPNAVAFSAATTSQFGALTLTFNLNLASTVRSGNYNFTLSLQWMTSQSSGLVQTAVLRPPPVAQLDSVFQIQGATWGAPTSQNAAVTMPVPGAQGEPLVVSLQYLGTASVSSIEGTVTLPSGFTDLNGAQSATAFAATATPNQVVTLTFYVDIGSGVKPGSYSFPISLSWLSSVDASISQMGTVAPPPVASPSSGSSFDLTVTQINSTVTDGSSVSAGFRLSNLGTATIYSPTFSLIVISPLVLTSAGSPVPAAQVTPGGNATFKAQVASGPSGTPGIYSGTLSVTFADSIGASHTQTFPVSFTVQGTVILILQDTAVSQTTSGFTVTGSILNEGSVAAYYASITGLLGLRSATPVYLGEIDPNTPLPFSVTVPFTAPATLSSNGTAAGNSSRLTIGNKTASSNSSRARGFNLNFSQIPGVNFSLPGGFGSLLNGSSGGTTVSIALSLTYKDTFGANKVQAFTVPATVETVSQLSGSGLTNFPTTSSGSSSLQYLAYGVVIAFAVVLVGGFVMLRRHRAKAFASLPPDRRGDQSVI